MGETRQVVALDIGGTKIASALVTFKEGERPEVSLYGKVPTEAKRGGKVVLQHAIESARRVIDAADGRVFGIGVSSGGVIDPATGNVTYANDMMPGWGGTHLGAELHAIFGIPVKVMNDVHAHAFGEAFWGAGFSKMSTLVCAVGTGIGGAYVERGHIMLGAHSEAGHIGHVACTDAAGIPCSCGRRDTSSPSPQALVSSSATSSSADAARSTTERRSMVPISRRRQSRETRLPSLPRSARDMLSARSWPRWSTCSIRTA